MEISNHTTHRQSHRQKKRHSHTRSVKHRSTNEPWQEGVYEYEYKTVSSPAYPTGKHETGKRTITTEDFGQRSISKGIVNYTDANGKLVTKDDYYEHVCLNDLDGKQIMLAFGSLGNYGINKFISYSNGDVTIESMDRSSDLIKDKIKQRSKSYKTKDGYICDAMYYNKNTKKYEPYRWGILKKIN